MRGRKGGKERRMGWEREKGKKIHPRKKGKRHRKRYRHTEKGSEIHGSSM
jgi:hypothetical protein